MKNLCYIPALCLMVSLSACFGSKPVAYFEKGNLDTAKVQSISLPDVLIQKGDLMSITIFSDNPEATAIFNQAGVAQAPASPSGVSRTVNTAGATGSNNGYLVDKNGYLRMHALGLIKAEGLTKEQLTDTIVARLTGLGVLTNPYAVVRFSNFKITVLGEVRQPGVFSVPVEKASVLEAIGLAGDITDYGMKDKVLLIRETDGKRSFYKLDLADPSIFSSPLFYLKQNDVVYIEPDKRKPTALDQQSLQYIMIAASLASTAAILISLFK